MNALLLLTQHRYARLPSLPRAEKRAKSVILKINYVESLTSNL